jgi:peptidoglycan/xylan/chitin deacetylase (PgdA/CDA1 family)
MYNYGISRLRDRSGVLYKVFAAALRATMGTITHVDTHESVAALTFDDGPHPEYTPRLLEILAKYQVRATFFMLGKSAYCHPEVVRQVAQEGHVIGNHTWDHPSFLSIPGYKRRAQIRACTQAIAPYGSRIFRPPYGYQSLASRVDILRLRHQVIAWSLDVCDWLERDGSQIAGSLMNGVRPGSIILLHDAVWQLTGEEVLNRQPMLAGVELLLERLADRMRFITIPELLKKGRPQRQNWYRKNE